MGISTQVSTDSSLNYTSASLSSKGSNLSSNVSNKSLKETSNMLDKSNSNSQVSKKDDFKETLNSKKQIDKTSKDTDSTVKSKKSVNSTDKKSDKTDDVKEKIEDLKETIEELKDSSDDKDVNDILAELLNALNKLLESCKTEEHVDSKINNSDLAKVLVDELSKNSDQDGQSVLEQLLVQLNSDDAKNTLDSDTLKGMKQLLTQLSSNLADDNSGVSKTMKDNLDKVLSKVTDMLDESENKGENVLSLRDILNKNYAQDNGKGASSSSENGTQNESAGSKENKAVSKEDKFLNSLLDDDKSPVDNKINLFSARVQNIQNPNADSRGLTINKATFTNDLIQDVKYMSTNSLKELTVKVNPGNLGEITIKLVQEDGLMKANLKANSKETTELLSQNLADIKKELGDQNIKISEVNIELYNDDTTFFKGESFGEQLSGEENRNNGNTQSTVKGSAGAQEDAVEMENLAQIDNNLDFLA